ncbi:MAG: malto-oligosyltrehalose synthase [Mycobacteriales bacterium]
MITSTYRLQLTPSFTLHDAAAVVPCLAQLGISHVYCSPWLASAAGSQHGYDVVDHSHVDDELGGAEGLAELHRACQEHGLGIVLDIVPNHMTIAAPEDRNAAWWSVLRDGPASPYKDWFDVDWSKRLLVPVLGGPLAEVVDALVLGEDRISYYEHVFPLAPGTLVAGDVLATLDRQHYRLADWRTASEESTHRRFFDVTDLVGLRVEDEAVFDATHALVLQQVRDGIVEGLRVDHPDGLADPGGYLARLAARTGGAWVVAEKILEYGEELPRWPCAGTTGYDALNLVTGLFVDPAGERPLTSLWQARTGDQRSWEEVVEASKRQVLDQVLAAEVERLVELAKPLCDAAHLDITRRGLREAFVEVLVAFDVYRAYLPGGEATIQWACEAASARLPSRAREIAVLGRLVLDPGELATRFQQTCGPVMAKGVEDTAFYRYLPLLALNEVGGDPGHWGTSVEDFHDYCARMLVDWPLTMTTLSTHDTKRSEDVRARLALLSQHPVEWGEAVGEWTAWLPRRIDAATEQLVWQTLVGAWPLDADRAVAYVEKAVHEAKAHTSWLDPDTRYDEAAAAFVRALLGDAHLVGEISAFVERLSDHWRSTLLAQKLVQLTMPGVADTYQGCELVDLSLVDPDNRRPVDFARRRALLEAPDGSLDSEKLQLVRAALGVRNRLAGYQPLDAAPDVLAYRRGPVAVAVPLRGGAATLALEGFEDLLPHLPVRLLVQG